MKTRNKKKTAVPATRVDWSASPHTLAQQLEKAHREIAQLRTTLASYQAVEHALTHRHDTLLDEVAAVLLLAQEAETAYQSTASDKSPGTHAPKKLEQPTPGGSTWHARRTAGRFRTEIRDAVDAFHYEREHMWQAPRIEDGIPRLRCCKRDCPARDIKVKAWRDVRGGRRIYTERCSSCGDPLVQVATDPAQQELNL